MEILNTMCYLPYMGLQLIYMCTDARKLLVVDVVIYPYRGAASLRLFDLCVSVCTQVTILRELGNGMFVHVPL